MKQAPAWETEVFEDDFEYHLGKPTDVKEVWFAGSHAGTLLPAATTDQSGSPTLKPLPLVNATALNRREVEEEQAVIVVEQTDPEADANATMNDQLVKGLMWLVLEYIPMSQYYQDSDGYWHRRLRWNACRPREIYNGTPNFHAPVKLRKDYEGKWLTRFIPKAGEQVNINYVE
ncbi:hypothetical protein FRC00_006938 [Tulasnella sp. 408]|nr:hypothetical protein FRC00_006938 [Tulasnella sp. 408]